MKKDHYRNVFKSDHLGSADLEDFIEQNKPLVFTIKEVKQEKGAKVAGKKIDANIAYFSEAIKPMVLNATNSKIIKSLCKTDEHPNGSPFVQDWKNVHVELYVDENVMMAGARTSGVRIRTIQPKTSIKQKPLFTDANFEAAKKAGASKEQIEAIYQLPEATWLSYEIYANIPTT